jgi:hypothetical protein
MVPVDVELEDVAADVVPVDVADVADVADVVDVVVCACAVAGKMRAE